MTRDGWKYYNHALISALPPDKIPPLESLENRAFWKKWGGYSVLARWCEEFDCAKPTEWWYVIKDEPFDISSIKAKRRYEINKGKKFFEVEEITPEEYGEAFYEVTVKAYASWPEKYRPLVDRDIFKENVKNWNDRVIFGAFDRESGSLCGYAMLFETESHAEFSVLRVVPEFERNGINAAMVAAIVEKYNDRLGNGFYINDGSRSIRHETAFQDYLEKYFGFRKAYCKLKIRYRFPFGFGIKILYPFRKLIFSNSKIGNIVSGLLKMEEIHRSCN